MLAELFASLVVVHNILIIPLILCEFPFELHGFFYVCLLTLLLRGQLSSVLFFLQSQVGHLVLADSYFYAISLSAVVDRDKMAFQKEIHCNPYAVLWPHKALYHMVAV